MQGDDILKAELKQALAECERLRAENAQLKAARLGDSPKPASRPVVPLATSQSPKTKLPKTLTTNSPADQKVIRFRSLFRGRDDVYAVRWEGKNGRTGYSLAGIRDWEQPAFTKTGKRKAFRLSKPFPISDDVVRDHLLGKQTIGIYPLLQDDTCWFVAVDFDKKSWKGDACAFLRTCQETGVPASLERSRSGNGGHVWIFFAEPIQAALARKLASAILTRTMEQHYALGLDSYDRLFPSQDTMPKGGFGNLIALPLQHAPREKGNSVFVDDQLRPYDDQWAYVSSIEQLTLDHTQSLLRRVYPTGDVINVKHSSSDYDESSDPWIAPTSERLALEALTEPLPQRVSINLVNLIFIEKQDLPDAFLDRLLRLAAFQNPEFYKTQAMRLSTFGKPRVIACGENLTRHVALPRGLWQEVRTLLESHNVAVDVADHRFIGNPLEVDFRGDRRPAQAEAAKALAAHEDGILCAPTAFGKTAVAAQLIAKRKVNTLVLVHRRHLMDQWRERLASYLGLNIKDIGQIGSGKTARTGKLDVAVIQSLIRKGEVKDLVAEYGQVIVDECHHVSAFSFERVLRKVKAKYIVGLTATPIRKDGHHPIILMQCGPIRVNVSSKRQNAASKFKYEVVPRFTEFTVPPEWQGIGIQDIYTALVNNESRTDLIVSDVVNAIEDGRFPLLLSERTDHLQILNEKLEKRVPNIFVMKGGMGKMQRDALASAIGALAEDQQRLIIATGRYIGEGFDNALLDTLFLAMPISWRGTLQQYVGRLHRLHENKRVVRVYDCQC
ncbi:MAG: hypothetical protein QOG23_1526 [Blastocatellia bacterium]|jgi:superfamily II DNA or RNA helicase|nr:hypothetical protein [Blastocatellia bacterium]